MNITPQQKKTGILVGILLILGGGAFVYLDPLDLDLLGLNPPPPVKKPAPKRPVKAPVKAPVPKPAIPVTAGTPAGATKANTSAPLAVSAPIAASTQMAASAPMATSTSPATSPVASAQSTAPSMKQKSTPVASKPAQADSNSKPEMSLPVVDDKSAMDEAKPMSTNSAEKFATNKTASSKPERPKDQDLRYCLDLPTNAEIAKCAGE